MLLPWQLCHAACHDRTELGVHDCHPEGRCPEAPGEESGKTSDAPLSFDSVQPAQAEPLAAPFAGAVPLACASAPVLEGAALPPEAPPPVPRTTVLLL